MIRRRARRAGTGEGSGVIRRRVRRGKIAQLPAAIRQQLNLMLHDNVPGPKVLRWLRETHPEAWKAVGLGKSGEGNLCQWRKGGFRDWQRQQERLEEMRMQMELALQLELSKYQDKVAEQKRKITEEIDHAKKGGLTPETIAKIEEAVNLL